MTKRSKVLVRTIIISTLVFGAFSCFDFNTDVHDNNVTVGNTCDIIKSAFATDAAAAICSDADASCPLKEAGMPCTAKEECQSDICLCEICIDPAKLL
jgi:hypothetical protein